MKQKFKLSITLLFLSFFSVLTARSVLRPRDNQMPELIARWEDKVESTEYRLRNYHLRPYPIFGVKVENNYDYFLPKNTDITFRQSPEKSVNSAIISKKINNLLQEMKTGKMNFTDFKVIHKSNFNTRKMCGLIVFKFNDYPFVLKLFIEKPEAFVNQYCTGANAMWIFFLSGGGNRHITGLTRIPNLKQVESKIASPPHWDDKISFPRKWIWMPKNTKWIHLEGENIGPTGHITTRIPAIYAIVADYIEKDKHLILSKKDKNKIAMRFCNEFDISIDAHAANFFFEKNPQTNEPRLACIDTEHFPTITGMKEPRIFTDYTDWYGYLAQKALRDMYFRSKSFHRFEQTNPSPMQLQ